MASVIVGVGVDIVGLARFRRQAERVPEMLQRVFHDEELWTRSGRRRGWGALAGCFAAKEAVAKVLGAPPGIDWRDTRVSGDGGSEPTLSLSGRSAVAAESLGILRWRLSIGHGTGFAYATAIAERDDTRQPDPPRENAAHSAPRGR